MNDVKKGIFEIDGIEVSKDTKVEDVITEKMDVYIDDTEGDKYAEICSYSNMLSFIGGEFSAEYCFFNDKLKEIEFVPFLGNNPGYPDLKYQKAKYDYCSNLLIKAFGKPDMEDERGISYSFDGGGIGCHQILDGRRKGQGGILRIRFVDRG